MPHPEMTNYQAPFGLEVLHNIYAAIWSQDASSQQILYVSTGIEPLTGYQPADFYGDRTLFTNIIHPADRQETLEELQRGKTEGRMFEVSCRFMHRNGNRAVYVLNHIVPVFGRDGRVARLDGVTLDVTDRVLMEKAMAESEERFHMIMSEVPVSIILIDVNGVMLEVNDWHVRHVCANTRTVADLVGHPLQDDPLFAGLEWKEQINRLLQGQSFEIAEYETIGRPEGRQLVLEVRGIPLHNSMGELTGGLIVLQDITEVKQLTSRMLQEQKARSIATLAQGIAHDYNNILVGILGQAALLKEDLADQPDPLSRVDIIESSSRKAADLTGQLVAYSRGGKYLPRPVHLPDIIDEAIRLLRVSLNSQTHIECEYADELDNIWGDPHLLQQVLFNLLLNADEASPDGGQIRVCVYNGRVPEAENDLEGVLLEVVDQGGGMPEEVRQRAFEPFFSTKFDGRGLGLAATEGIVGMHDGTISLTSTPDQGTRAVIFFPKTENRMVLEEMPVFVPQPTSTNQQILVVDDDEVVRRTIQFLLQNIGYRVQMASDADEGIELFAEICEDLDMVILDLGLADNGTAIIVHEMRRMSSETVLVVSSGKTFEQVEAQLLQLKIEYFIQKPYTATELGAQIQRIFHRQQR